MQKTTKTLHAIFMAVCWLYLGYIGVSLAPKLNHPEWETLLISFGSMGLGIFLWKAIKEVFGKSLPKSEKHLWDTLTYDDKINALNEWHRRREEDRWYARRSSELDQEKKRLTRQLHVIKNIHARMQARLAVNHHTLLEEIGDNSMIGDSSFARYELYVSFTDEERGYIGEGAFDHATKQLWEIAQEELAEVPCMLVSRPVRHRVQSNAFKLKRILTNEAECFYNKWYDFFYAGKDGVWNPES